MSWFQAPAPLVPDLIAGNGRWRAELPALVDGALRLSWREFAADTARVANGLAALGVRPQRARGRADGQPARDRAGVVWHHSRRRRRGATQCLDHGCGGGWHVRRCRLRCRGGLRALLRAHRCTAHQRCAARAPLHRMRCAGARLARSAGADGGAGRDGSGRGDRPGRRVQSHLQFRHHGIAEGHRPHARVPDELGLRRRDRLALPQRLPHAVLAWAVLEHQLGQHTGDDTRWRHDRAVENLPPARSARTDRGRAHHARRLRAGTARAAARSSGPRRVSQRQPRDTDVLRLAARRAREARVRARVRLPSDRALRPHRGADHDS